MLVEEVADPRPGDVMHEIEFRLSHITRRVPAGTTLICYSPNGKLPWRLKDEGFKSGMYCQLTWWVGDLKSRLSAGDNACMIRRSGPTGVLITKAELVYFYPANKHLRWRERVFRAQWASLVAELDYFRCR